MSMRNLWGTLTSDRRKSEIGTGGNEINYSLYSKIKGSSIRVVKVNAWNYEPTEINDLKGVTQTVSVVVNIKGLVKEINLYINQETGEVATRTWETQTSNEF